MNLKRLLVALEYDQDPGPVLQRVQVRIAACVDSVHEDETDNGRDPRLLLSADDLAASLPAKLYLVHAYEPPPTGLVVEFDAVLGQSGFSGDEVRLHHRNAFDQLIEGRVEASLRCRFEEGSPAGLFPRWWAKRALTWW